MFDRCRMFYVELFQEYIFRSCVSLTQAIKMTNKYLMLYNTLTKYANEKRLRTMTKFETTSFLNRIKALGQKHFYTMIKHSVQDRFIFNVIKG